MLIHTFIVLQSFGELAHRPLLVDLTIEDQSRLKVIYGSAEGFHAVDLDSATVYDIYLPKHVSIWIRTRLLFYATMIFIKYVFFFWELNRRKDRSYRTASSHCRIRTVCSCCCATITKVYMSTPLAECPRILYCR